MDLDVFKVKKLKTGLKMDFLHFREIFSENKGFTKTAVARPTG